MSQVSKNEAVAELTRPVAGVLLTLMSSLSQTFRVSDMAESTLPPADTEQLSQFIAVLDEGRTLPTLKSSSTLCGGSRSSYASSFQLVLRGILQHMIGCSEYSTDSTVVLVSYLVILLILNLVMLYLIILSVEINFIPPSDSKKKLGLKR